jgi:hypothetical protein
MPRRQPRPAKTLAEEAANRFLHRAKANGDADRLRLRASLRAMKQSADVIATAHGLAVAWRELGHRPTQQEYADYWGFDVRTAERDFKRWSEVFGRRWVEDFPDLGPELDIYTVAERLVLEHGELVASDDPQAVLSAPFEQLLPAGR